MGACTPDEGLKDLTAKPPTSIRGRGAGFKFNHLPLPSAGRLKTSDASQTECASKDRPIKSTVHLKKKSISLSLYKLFLLANTLINIKYPLPLTCQNVRFAKINKE
jgi:hypothetical protein